MTRGDIVLVREPKSPASKARPSLIVQRTSTLKASSKITLCPITSTLKGGTGRRPFVAPSPENGLLEPSEVQVDWIFSFFRESVGRVIGRLDDVTMREVDAALRRWLDL